MSIRQFSRPPDKRDWRALAADIKRWGRELGFQGVGIADTDLTGSAGGLRSWLGDGCHGDMHYMAKHSAERADPGALVPGTVRIITARMDYHPPLARASRSVLTEDTLAFISRYALGRDYHKLMRRRLQQLADRLEQAVGPLRYRAFSDSAPVMEVELARKAGLGWRGKHTLLLSREHGSWFFLGELYVDLPLPVDEPGSSHCGTCAACLAACPTQAFVAPYRLDARRCISYLTIEHRGSIPIDLRPLFGNRIYGCDDCQLVCPWNRFAQPSDETDFRVRQGLDDVALVALFAWSEAEFATRLAGSPIRRIGHERWLRNIAVALGNAATSKAIVAALESKRDHASPLVREHVAWALARHAAPHM
ncbi:MAG: tRNA epoxyqueuosine(34) reductase QueG [Betaproteobacteria bacterium]|nr:tRNA epoxyqueuosine(34) reductase QueG [Betaproteobacteria bacterium]